MSGGARTVERTFKALRVKKDQEFEKAFLGAGGLLLMVGADPTGNGSALAAFADQLNVKLPVAGEFAVSEASRMTIWSDAKLLGPENEGGRNRRGSRRNWRWSRGI